MNGVFPSSDRRVRLSDGYARPRRTVTPTATDSLLPMTFAGIPADDFTGHWHVAQVEGGKEKAFVSDLMRREVPFFAPWEVVKIRDVQRHTRVIQRALFPGYVFINGESSVYDARDCRGWLGRIQVAERSQPKLRGELASLYNVMLHDPVITKPLGIGSYAEIIGGPFEGMSGPVVAHANGMQLVLQITMLGQSIAVEISPEMVEAA